MPDAYESLIDKIYQIGTPPQGVSLETYAIAKIKPKELNQATNKVVPTYEDRVRFKEHDPEYHRFLSEEPQIVQSLGEAIKNTQFALARGRRRAVAGVTALTCGLAMGGGQYAIYQDIRADYPKSEPKELKAEEIGYSVGLGALGLIGGGTSTYLISLSLSHRLARKPAQKIVSRAQQDQVQL